MPLLKKRPFNGKQGTLFLIKYEQCKNFQRAFGKEFYLENVRQVPNIPAFTRILQRFKEESAHRQQVHAGRSSERLVAAKVQASRKIRGKWENVEEEFQVEGLQAILYPINAQVPKKRPICFKIDFRGNIRLNNNILHNRKKNLLSESRFLLTFTWVDIGQTGTKISQKLKKLYQHFRQKLITKKKRISYPLQHYIC